MHVVVVGAGVVGITTAHYLVAAGHRVTVVDREADVAMGTSFANAAQLSYSFADAMATPQFAASLPGLLAGRDPAILIRPTFDWTFLRWGLSFLRQCTTSRAHDNTSRALQLAVRSSVLLAELRAKLPDNFSYRAASKVVLLRTRRQVLDAESVAAMKMEYGCPANVISMAEAIAIEPAIASMSSEYIAAIYAPGDEVADARAFSQTLASSLKASGRCEFRMNTVVDSLQVERQCIRGLQSGKELIDAGAVVVCAGVFSGALLKPLGIDPGIYPVRGYSVTLPIGDQSPTVSLTDAGKRFVISRLQDGIRIAGFADFLGMDTSRDDVRIKNLLAVARQHAPLATNYDSTEKHGWGGFRPTTVSGYPNIGRSKITGLYLNTGHGSLGWTMACASASDLANMFN